MEHSAQIKKNFFYFGLFVCAKLLQSCLTLCDPMDCSQPGSAVHGDSLGKNTGVGCHFLLQGDLPDPGIKPASPAQVRGFGFLPRPQSLSWGPSLTMITRDLFGSSSSPSQHLRQKDACGVCVSSFCSCFPPHLQGLHFDFKALGSEDHNIVNFH